ncbi:hypothetical protein [Streptomyces sp. NPDC055287]
MADERYEWLDKETAERLLRGEPVGPVGDHARAQAERLSAALDGVARAGGRDAGELPGEAAALAAFRKVRAASPEDFATVRIGRRAAVPVRWARPVRLGLAGAIAGVALGGVAVAAGTGVLPSPFGPSTDPAPATSVSAAATPPPVTPGATTPEPGATGGPTPESTGTPGDAHETPGGGDDTAGATQQPTPGSETGVPPDYPGWTGEGTPGTGDGGTAAGDWYRKTAKACQDYRSGSLAPDHERRLEAAAEGADRVARFCDRLLDGSGDRDDTDGGADEGRSGGHGGANGDDADGESRDGDGDGGKNGGSDRSEATDGSEGAPGGIRRPAPPVSYTLTSSPTGEPSAVAGAATLSG